MGCCELLVTVWARPGWAGPGLQRANEMSDKMWPDNGVQSDGEITQPPLPASWQHQLLLNTESIDTNLILCQLPLNLKSSMDVGLLPFKDYQV